MATLQEKVAAQTQNEPKEEEALTPAQKGAITKAKKKAAKVEEETTPPVVSKSEERRQAVLTVSKEEAEEKARRDELQKLVLKNVLGEVVPNKDYFYKGIVPPGFEGTCGLPVDREDLLAVFNKVFKPEDNFLFYRQRDKEVYLLIVPLRNSKEIGEEHDSFDGDFQKHAISFLDEGSVNLDKLRQKLEKAKNFVKFDDR